MLVKRYRRGKTTWGKLAQQLHILNRSVKAAKQDLKLTKEWIRIQVSISRELVTRNQVFILQFKEEAMLAAVNIWMGGCTSLIDYLILV